MFGRACKESDWRPCVKGGASSRMRAAPRESRVARQSASKESVRTGGSQAFISDAAIDSEPGTFA